MPHTIQCFECGVVLNLPDQAAGRRLKCPRCGARFLVGADGSTKPAAAPAGDAKAGSHGPDTTFELTRKQSSADMPVLPTAAGDLRETFDLDSMTGAATSPAKPKSPAGGREADALALFEDKPSRSRKKTGAEARSQARRCPTCGGVVAVGMSICNVCGLDLESGMRVGLDDDLAPPPVARDPGLPILMTVLGGVCLALSVALGVVALLYWQRGNQGVQYFIPIAGFGVYAAVQFIRVKSVKLLLLALTLGALIDVSGLIVMPIVNANVDTTVVQRSEASDDPDAALEIIRPVSERLDTQRIWLGTSLLAVYALTSVYLLSPTVQRQFKR